MLAPNTLSLIFTFFFLRERVIAKHMTMKHVPKSLQVAYTLSKPLGTLGFQELHTKLKVVQFNPP